MINAVAVRPGRPLAQKPEIHHFGKQRAALIRITQDHVHHLIIARIAKRFVVSPIREGRAHDERMQLPLREILMDRPQLRFNAFRNALQPFVHGVESRDHGAADFLHGALFHFQPVAGGSGADLQLHLFQPEPKVRQECLHVGHHDFKLGQHSIEPLPMAHKGFETLMQRSGVNAGRKRSEHETGFIQLGFTDQHRAGVDQAGHHRASGIDRALIDDNLEAPKHLGCLQNQARTINLEDREIACQPQQAGADFDTLAALANHQAVFDRAVFHNVRLTLPDLLPSLNWISCSCRQAACLA